MNCACMLMSVETRRMLRLVPFTPESLGCKGHQVSTRPISQHVSDDVFSTGSDLSILEFDIASNHCVFTDPISQ